MNPLSWYPQRPRPRSKPIARGACPIRHTLHRCTRSQASTGSDTALAVHVLRSAGDHVDDEDGALPTWGSSKGGRSRCLGGVQSAGVSVGLGTGEPAWVEGGAGDAGPALHGDEALVGLEGPLLQLSQDARTPPGAQPGAAQPRAASPPFPRPARVAAAVAQTPPVPCSAPAAARLLGPPASAPLLAPTTPLPPPCRAGHLQHPPAPSWRDCFRVVCRLHEATLVGEPCCVLPRGTRAGPGVLRRCFTQGEDLPAGLSGVCAAAVLAAGGWGGGAATGGLGNLGCAEALRAAALVLVAQLGNHLPPRRSVPWHRGWPRPCRCTLKLQGTRC